MEYLDPPQKVDLVHQAEPDEWCVTVDGARVLSFSGPSAWSKAVSHKAELEELLVDHPVDSNPDAPRGVPGR